LIVKTLKTKAGKERQTFGRYVAEVYVLIGEKWIWLNEALVEEGHAVRSTG
jgi:endonuclease YncB( thermonuclease family)